MKLKKIWLVPHPTSQFNENVKELAADNGLRIIDAKFTKEIHFDFIATDPPKLTKTKEASSKDATKQKVVK